MEPSDPRPDGGFSAVTPFWATGLAALAGVACVACGIWLFEGVVPALVAALAGVTMLCVNHLRQLHRLIRWADQPIGNSVPNSHGVWDYAFSALSRRSRRSLGQRAQLSAALERFRAASQAMPDGVLILGRSNDIEWLNNSAQAHFDLRDRDMGQHVANFIRQPEFLVYLEGARYAEPLVLRSMRAGGCTLTVQVIEFGDDQKLVLTRDISRLQKLETMRQDFVANVSHELRTPLTVVAGCLETLRDERTEMSDEEIAHYLTLADGQAVQMRRLIDDLLALSALETGSPPPQEQHVSLVPLLATLEQEAKALSAGRHRISLVQAQGDGQLLGSERELHSAFGNLVSNAVRYTPEGGTIELEWVATGEWVEFRVRDTGIGIERHHLPRLTERFYRVDRGRSREVGGTGLGLAIVKHVLTRHQGSVQIESAPGRGSCFAARLPRWRFIPRPS